MVNLLVNWIVFLLMLKLIIIELGIFELVIIFVKGMFGSIFCSRGNVLFLFKIKIFCFFEIFL